MNLQCPRCSTALTDARHQTGLAWRCDRCRGQSLNYSQFRKLIPELEANDIWQTVVEHPVPPPRPTPCPECRAEMSGILIPWQGHQTELDICLNCQRMWMDARDPDERLDISPVAHRRWGMPVFRKGRRGIPRPASPENRRRESRPMPPGVASKLRYLIVVALWVGVSLLLPRCWKNKRVAPASQSSPAAAPN